LGCGFSAGQDAVHGIAGIMRRETVVTPEGTDHA
jgi:hypothetical protein